MKSVIKIYQMEDGSYCVMSTNGFRSFNLAEFASKEEAEIFRDYYKSPKKNITLYLPLYLIARIDVDRQASSETRSDFIRHLLETHYGIKSIY